MSEALAREGSENKGVCMQEDRGDPDLGSTPGVSHSPKHGGREIAASVLNFDLQTEVDQLQQQPSYREGDHSGRTLVKEPDLRIVLMVFRAGARMQEHHASGPISIQALQGSLRAHLSDASIDLAPGQLLVLESGIRHDVEAIEDSAFLLTIGRTLYQRGDPAPHEPGA